MFERTAGKHHSVLFAAQQNMGLTINWLRDAVSSVQWSARFANACARELRINETQGQFRKLIEEDCLKRIFQRTEDSL